MSHKDSERGVRYFNDKIGRTQSSLSVSAVDNRFSVPTRSSPSSAVSTVTLTPGRIRNIDQDMEALRASRQDNPFLKQIIASRESLVESLEETESDDINLMSKEFPTDLDVDPLSLQETHEHMIRSPPPIYWPKSPTFQAFQFPEKDEELLQVEFNSKSKSPKSDKPKKHTSWSGAELSSVPRPHPHHFRHSDRFSLLSPHSLLSTSEDSVGLMSLEDS
ncbi:uncharacterized protein LOC108739123 [Agrilus planipennis]|uniref:Uncharacterized protein LOC108739123 n=1 Tax=Agrilus planipennis TaxID=224129 RepID=A0A1W4X7J2_AGRPL|nr:uncharacterized protein LOC108739123 [Agrilus planipennis]